MPLVIIYCSFVIRIFISVYNVFYGPLPGANFDAVTYLHEAENYKNYLEDVFFFDIDNQYQYKTGWYYSNFLGLIYFIFGNNEFLVTIISSIIWLISALIFYKILKLLKTKEKKILIACLSYSFLFPFSFILLSVTLREVYLLLLLNLITLSFLSFFYKKNIVLYFAYLLIFTFAYFILLHLHTAYEFLTILLPFIIIFSFLIKKSNITSFYVGSIFFLIILYFLPYELFFEKIKYYRLGHFSIEDLSRAYYDDRSSILSLNYDFLSFLFFVIKNVFNYFFQPMIWYSTNVIDGLLILENIFRIVLFYLVAKQFINYNNNFRFIFLFMFLFFSETIYAQATVNWGTAVRHHLPSMGILLILAFGNFKFHLKNIK